MSRSGYTDDIDDLWGWIRYRGAVNSSITGKRGQDFLKELRSGLDEMEIKELISGELETQGQFCALGVVGKNRWMNLDSFDKDSSEQVSKAFNIAKALAAEVARVNDIAEYSYRSNESNGQRWVRVRNWVESNIKKDK